MIRSFRDAPRRVRVLAASAASVLLVSASAAPALAAGLTPYTANFTETTTLVGPCPPQVGAPAGSTCFVGVGRGPSIPPGDPNAVERYAGYFTPTGQDFNVVSITTNQGTLFVTTAGNLGANLSETGQWTAHGGTGIFEGATGGGNVTTAAQPVGPQTIDSNTTYTGALTLRS